MPHYNSATTKPKISERVYTK